MIKGIDVSDHQGSAYSTDGLDFVFVKATEGRSWINPKQHDQAAHGRKAGLVVGWYHFLWPGNIAAQARYFVDKCGSVEGDPLFVDWETTGSGTRASCAEKDQFIREVRKLRPGHRVGLYCNRDFWLNRDTTSFAGDALWIADYNGRPGHPGIEATWLFHQYTSSPLDTNVGAFADRAALRRWAGDPHSETEDAMPERSLYSTTEGHTQTARPGTWLTLTFDRIYQDGDWHTKKAEQTVLNGPASYVGGFAIRARGLAAGQEIQLRLGHNYRDSSGWHEGARMPIASPVHDAGDGHFTYTWQAHVGGSHDDRVVCQVLVPGGDDPAVIEWARAELLYWKG
ncbi:hypothetical protein D7294_20870 [Streptomyces hoynatensis]|uniref:Muramidase n=1 Tax=Streptomyces hoynatensis TaxID=1141874 RepID=A0A3A9YW48_9ACTN|nr:hypothetical protein D7294_20870 [Streptomyces hoynatensis]